MHDSLGMRRIQCIGNLNSEIQQLVCLERLAGDELAHSLAFEQLHGDERSFLVFVDIVDDADVRMI